MIVEFPESFKVRLFCYVSRKDWLKLLLEELVLKNDTTIADRVICKIYVGFTNLSIHPEPVTPTHKNTLNSHTHP